MPTFKPYSSSICELWDIPIPSQARALHWNITYLRNPLPGSVFSEHSLQRNHSFSSIIKNLTDTKIKLCFLQADLPSKAY